MIYFSHQEGDSAASFACSNPTTSPVALLQGNKAAKWPTAVRVTPEAILSQRVHFSSHSCGIKTECFCWKLDRLHSPWTGAKQVSKTSHDIFLLVYLPGM